MIQAVIFICAALACALLTGVTRRYALQANLLDTPNDRSSHEIPTPSGGGLAIVILLLIGLPVMSKFQIVDPKFVQAGLGAGLAVAVIGILDDYRHIPAPLRLIVHFAAAFWLLILLLPNLGLLMTLLAAIGLVWVLNLYNFMDGIDGIAGIEALTVCIGGIVLAQVASLPGAMMTTPCLLAGAALGFLCWNFPKAKIFMGDVGSGFVGIVIGALIAFAATISAEQFWGWLILLGCFIVDATVTLARRIFRRQKIYEAHRSHAYQIAARRYSSHSKISMTVGAINMLWLLPVSTLLVAGLLSPAVALIVAWTPLIIIAFYFGAGSTDS